MRAIQNLFSPWKQVKRSVTNMLPYFRQQFGSLDLLRTILSGTNVDYGSRAGKIYDNPTVFPAITWYWRNMQSCRIVVQKRIKTPSGNIKWEEVIDHKLPLAICNDPQRDETITWFGTLLSYFVNGNAYWYKLVNTFGEVVGYRYIPNAQILPKNDKYNPDGTKLISYYEYQTQDGKKYNLDPEYVIHFKHGLDPLNEALGLAPVVAALREVVGDNTAATISVALLENAGIAGIALVPKNGVIEELTEAERLDFTTRWKENTTGDNAGSPNLLPFPVDVVQLGHKPSDMVLDRQRAEAVSRILAAFGIDPMVLGFSSDQKTYSNFGEAMASAWETGLLPTMTILAKQLTKQGLWDFEEPSTTLRVSWDTSEVRALQEDTEKMWNRVRQAYRDGMITRAVALSKVGLEYDMKRDDVYVHDIIQAAAETLKEQKQHEENYKEKKAPKTKKENE